MFRGLPKPNKKIGTEWDDIQRRLGNLPPVEENEEDSEEEIDYALKNKSDEIRENLENGVSLEKMEEMEDRLGGDDDTFFEEYRKKRMAELQAKAKKEMYGEMIEICEQEYKEAVATPQTWIIVFLWKSGIPHCELLYQQLNTLAHKFPATKFLKIRADEAIHNYPDRNLPTVLIYNNGDLKGNLIGMNSFKGESTTIEDVEWKLFKLGAVSSDMEQDPRREPTIKGLHTRYVNRTNVEEEDDW